MFELLRTTRVRAQSLWDKVAARNEEHAPDPEKSTKVSFYVGQTIELSEEE